MAVCCLKLILNLYLPLKFSFVDIKNEAMILSTLAPLSMQEQIKLAVTCNKNEHRIPKIMLIFRANGQRRPAL